MHFFFSFYSLVTEIVLFFEADICPVSCDKYVIAACGCISEFRLTIKPPLSTSCISDLLWINLGLFSIYGLAKSSLITRFKGPTWGPPGADRTQVGPMLAPWTLLSGLASERECCTYAKACLMQWPGWFPLLDWQHMNTYYIWTYNNWNWYNYNNSHATVICEQ